jgi:SIR2-like domain
MERDVMSNVKDNLFNLIRREEVVLWAGAGLSIAAGYPSGNQLKTLLFDSLNIQEQQVVKHEAMSLSEFAEEYCRLKRGDRNALLTEVKRIFESIRVSHSASHQVISTIPHFQTIITTNYDDLFERAYGSNIQVFVKETDVAALDKSKVQLLKVHGDFFDHASMILTSSDYVNFFASNSLQSVLWAMVRERMASNAVCFVGYSLDDYNTRAMVEAMARAMGTHNRERFFVAPGQPSHKVADLERRGIKYIDQDADSFFSELLTVLKRNILNDFHERRVSPETLRKFLTYHRIRPSLEATE